MADFWEKDLALRDGVYHVVGDGMHERTDGNIRENGVPEDPVNTLGYLKTFFTWLPKISEALELDEEKRTKWQEIAQIWRHIQKEPFGNSGNPTLWKEVDVKLEDLLPQEMLDKEIYYDEGVGGKWSFHFPGNIMHIYARECSGAWEVLKKSWKWREIQCIFTAWWRINWVSWSIKRLLRELLMRKKKQL